MNEVTLKFVRDMVRELRTDLSEVYINHSKDGEKRPFMLGTMSGYSNVIASLNALLKECE